MKNKYEEHFGKRGVDRVTGFTGTISGLCIYAYGCTQYLLTPKVDKDGKIQDGQWFDVSRIAVIEQEEKIEGLKGDENGCDSCAPATNY